MQELCSLSWYQFTVLLLSWGFQPHIFEARGVPDAELAPTLAAGTGCQLPGSWLILRQQKYCWNVKWMLFSGDLRLAVCWDFLFWLCRFPNLFGASSDCVSLGEQRCIFGAGRGNAGGLNHSTSLGMGETAQSGGTSENGRAEGVSCLETESFFSERERAQKGVG